MKNRVLSVLLTLCMVLALFPGTAFAAGNNRAAEGSIGTNGNEVYAVGSDVTLADLVSAVSASGTVAVDKSYTLAEDTTPVQINKAFTDGLYVVSAKTTEPDPEPVKYTITVAEAVNGTVSTDPANEAAEGDVVTVTANANEGYVLEKITVVDANSNNVTVTDSKFTMPAANVPVTVTFAAI